MTTASGPGLQIPVHLQWHIPAPGPLVKATGLLPPVLAALRDAALVHWPTVADSKEERTEDLVRYIAALTVAMRVRADLKPVLQAEQVQCLHALAYVFDQLASRYLVNADWGQYVAYGLASVRAARMAGSACQKPDELRVLELQCVVGHFLNAADDGAVPHILSACESSLITVADPACLGYMKATEAYWRAARLMNAAPSPILKEEEMKFAVSHVRENKVLRERHYVAALSVMEENQRWLQPLDDPLLKSLQKQVPLHVRVQRLLTDRVVNERGAYDASTAHFETDDLANVPLLVLGNAEKTIEPPTQTERCALDAVLQREVDSWSATAAAASLTQDVVVRPLIPFILEEVMQRVMGYYTLPKSHRGYAPALMAAIAARILALELGEKSGVDCVRDIQRLQQARQALVESVL